TEVRGRDRPCVPCRLEAGATGSARGDDCPRSAKRRRERAAWLGARTAHATSSVPCASRRRRMSPARRAVQPQRFAALRQPDPGALDLAGWSLHAFEAPLRPARRQAASATTRKFFGCRHCYDLTYLSSQEAHQGDALVGRVAENLRTSLREVKRAAA